MFQLKQENVVNSEGGEVDPNSTNAAHFSRNLKSKNMGWDSVCWIVVAWFMFVFLVFLARIIMPYSFTKYHARNNLPNIPSAEKSLEADGKFEGVCNQPGLLQLLKCITKNKLHGTQVAQEGRHFEDLKQQHKTHSPKILRIRPDNTSNETEDPYYIDFHKLSYATCRLPTSLKTAAIECKMWTKYIFCESYCIDGNTYEEGTVRTHFCKHVNNEWSNKFEECKPIVDCKPKLVSPGKIKCFKNRTLESTTCEISCGMSEAEVDKDSRTNEIEVDTNIKTNEVEVDTGNKSSEVEGNTGSKTDEAEGGTDNEKNEGQVDTDTETYECYNDGTWDPPLPSCVAQGIHLVTASEVTEHDVSYSETGRDYASYSEIGQYDMSYSETEQDNLS